MSAGRLSSDIVLFWHVISDIICYMKHLISDVGYDLFARVRK